MSALLWDYKKRMDTRHDELFKITYGTWNQYCLNARESIGYSMKLIRECHPNEPSEWEKFYLKSGEEGKAAKDALPDTLSVTEREMNEKVINANHGKTLDELEDLARVFESKLAGNGITVTHEEAFNFVFIRACDEAFIGYSRELAAENKLTQYCEENGLNWKTTDAHVDVKQGVDYEIYKDDTLVCGVQVKGSSYKGGLSESKDFRAVDARMRRLMASYSREKDAPVFFMFTKGSPPKVKIQSFGKFDDKVQNRLEELGLKPTEKEQPGLDDVLAEIEESRKEQDSGHTEKDATKDVRDGLR